MKLEEKTAAVSTLHEKFDKATIAILTECSGLPVNTLSELRKKLRGRASGISSGKKYDGCTCG